MNTQKPPKESIVTRSFNAYCDERGDVILTQHGAPRVIPAEDVLSLAQYLLRCYETTQRHKEQSNA